LMLWYSCCTKDVDRLAVPYNNGTSLYSDFVSSGKTVYDDQYPFKRSKTGRRCAY
jgi:hypothetical protein